jgi:MFS family permease
MQASKPIANFIQEYRKVLKGFSPNAVAYLQANFLIGLSYAVYGVIFNLYLSQAGFQEGFIGGMLSLGGLAFGLFAIPGGLLSDRTGRKRSMLGASLAGSFFLLLRAMTINRTLLVASSFLGGLAVTVYNISAAPFMMENSRPHERNYLFSLSFAATLLAGVLGNLLGGKLPDILNLALRTGDRLLLYRLTLAAGALISFFSLWPLFRIKEPGRRENDLTLNGPAAGREDWWRIGKFSWCNLWIGLGAGLVIPFFNLYFAKRFGSTSGQIGFYFSVSQVLTALAVLAGPQLAKRIGRINTVVLMELLSLPFLVTLGAVEHSLTLAVLAFWMRASLMQMSSPIANAFTMEALPRRVRATANSLTSMSWNLAWALSTAFSGWMMQRYGYAVPYYLTAFCYLVSSVSYYLFFSKADAEMAKIKTSENNISIGGFSHG